MKETFQAFDWHRIFIGDTPLVFFAEIILRTVIMYAYTIFLLRILGKRGMGQLSTLELAIIIGFGSAVGDPMINVDVPVTYGLVAITVITLLQIGLEKIINANKKVEAVMEGAPNLVISNGILKLDSMVKDNLSKEDLFRMLRVKDVKHLGEIDKSFFETTGQLSVLLHAPEDIQPGLTVMPENLISSEDITVLNSGKVNEDIYCCVSCGNRMQTNAAKKNINCSICSGNKWTKAIR
jgi:uncharacterized membrane protein YcaP (DUF421 family)